MYCAAYPHIPSIASGNCSLSITWRNPPKRVYKELDNTRLLGRLRIKWQRLINPKPDVTVEFSVHADPNTAGTTFEPSGAVATNMVSVSTVNGSQWTCDGSAFVTYTPPASTAWYAVGGTTDAGSNKSGAIHRIGKVGIGTSTPGTSLEINASSANTSGLNFTNLTSATPTTSGATLGVDASGNVVTVNGSSFSPEFGTASPSSTINVSSGNSAEHTRITITSKYEGEGPAICHTRLEERVS